MLTGHFFPEPVILDVDLEDGLPVAQALSAFITRRPSAKQKEAKISTPNPRFWPPNPKKFGTRATHFAYQDLR
jgi:hypothetical protein